MESSPEQRPVYLAVCAIFRWEADRLREWLAFHRLVGVEHFFMYDNGAPGEDDHREALRPFIDDGSVTVQPWPVYPGQQAAYDHCVEHHRQDARWIAFIDCDEFLFSPAGRPLPEVLRRYERWPGVGVNRVWMGTSNHRTKPAGLVLANFVHRLALPEPNKAIKTIADPRRVEHSMNVHCFVYRDGALAVDEDETPFEGWVAEHYDYEQLRINHYFTKSEQEAVAKFARPQAGGKPRPKLNIDAVRRRNERFAVPDRTIQRHLPALEERLARLERGLPFDAPG